MANNIMFQLSIANSQALKRFSFFFVMALLLAGCLMEEPTLVETSIAPTTGTDQFSVYFTEPISYSSGDYSGGPDEALAQAIRQAHASVDLAVLQFDLFSLRDALIEAHQRGVTVRVVIDSDYSDEDAIRKLKKAGIEVLGDRQEGLMHNKFVVIDRSEVWSGSMNFTFNDAYRNNNNLIRIRSTRLAQDYTTEFEEMFVDDQFGPGGLANTPYPVVNVDGSRLEVYFSPDDGAADRLIELIQTAQESICFMAFSFTSDDLAEAIFERAEAGVTVSGVFEESQYYSNTGTEFDHFASAGLDVHLDGNSRNMHHKVFIIDNKIVITGSYNFSFNAENKNDENSLIIHNPDIAALYLAEFQQVLSQAQEAEAN